MNFYMFCNAIQKDPRQNIFHYYNNDKHVELYINYMMPIEICKMFYPETKNNEEAS